MNNEEFELLGEPRMTMAQFTLEEQLYGLEESDEEREDDMNPEARMKEAAPDLYAELDLIVEAWELIDVGKVPGRELTPWEKERLNFSRDLLDQIDGN